MVKRKNRPDLTQEDQRLWKKVTDTVTPRTGQSSVNEVQFQSLLKTISRDGSESTHDMVLKKGLKTTSFTTNSQPPVLSALSSALPSVSGLDRRQKSRLARGIVEIDGRLDLHGYTQKQAYHALHTFIGRAYASHWGAVLVITGKGSRNNHNNMYVDCLNSEEPGVLRRKVPQWLAEPVLKPFIISYDSAASVHGGSGALYVRIRKKR